MGGEASSGVKKNGHGDPYAHAPAQRAEQAATAGLMGAGNAREIPTPQNQSIPVANDSPAQMGQPDPYGIKP